MAINLLMSLTAYSQRLALSKTNDTILVFNLNEARYLLTEHYTLQKCEELRGVCDKQLAYSDSLLTEKGIIIDVEKKIIDNQQEILKLKQNEIDALIIMNLGLKNEVKKQRIQKRFAIVGGAILVGIVGLKRR